MNKISQLADLVYSFLIFTAGSTTLDAPAQRSMLRWKLPTGRRPILIVAVVTQINYSIKSNTYEKTRATKSRVNPAFSHARASGQSAIKHHAIGNIVGLGKIATG
jgi:hypothetical protein